MGTATSKQEDPGSKNEANDESGDSQKPTEKEKNEYKGNDDYNNGPVIEAEIVPIDGIQVRSFLEAPGVCPPGYRMDAKGKCRKVQ